MKKKGQEQEELDERIICLKRKKVEAICHCEGDTDVEGPVSYV